MPKLQPPCNSGVYQSVCALAREADAGEGFRQLCMLIDAPSDLRCLTLVARNLIAILDEVPPDWILDEALIGMEEVVRWIVRHAEIFKRLGVSAGRTSTRTSSVHPMFGLLTRHPIYSMLCNLQQVGDCRGQYRLLQLQVLHARARELSSKNKGEFSYITMYESNAGAGDFAPDVRQPDHAALAVRELSRESAEELVRFMKPEENPNTFAKSLRARKERPVGFGFGARVIHIASYCHPVKRARKGGTRISGERTGGPAPHCYGYVEYREDRVGVEWETKDPDAECFAGQGSELIFESAGTVDEALLHDDEPYEAVAADLVLVRPSVPRAIATAEETAIQAANSVRLEIDAELFRWSAFHLRPEEIASTLLSTLREYAGNPAALTSNELEISALVAVCLETARPLEHAAALQYSLDPRGDLTLLRSPTTPPCLRWAWPGIQPLYKTNREYVDGLEVKRVQNIETKLHSVADKLLTRWINTRSDLSFVLFTKPIHEYRARVKQWLHELDPTGRLTCARIARLKWSLLLQRTGGSYPDASLILGMPHPKARVQLFYSLLSIKDAVDHFAAATDLLWAEGRAPAPERATPPSEKGAPTKYVGCRAFPELSAVRDAISTVRQDFTHMVERGNSVRIGDRLCPVRDPSSGDAGVRWNRALLYVIWHQCFAIGHRTTTRPYIPRLAVSERSGLTTLRDKDTGSGYKARLVWMPPTLLHDMQRLEAFLPMSVEEDATASSPCLFFYDHLAGRRDVMAVTSHTIEQVSQPFFPFSANTPRRVMRHLLCRYGMSAESVKVYMGHWSSCLEPWGKWSSFSYRDYLAELHTVVPAILMDLGFTPIMPVGRLLRLRRG